MKPTPPLIAAVIAGDLALVKSKIAAGDDIHHEDPKKSTALIQAAKLGHVDIAKLLVQHGADAEKHDSKGKCAMQYCRDKDMAITMGWIGIDFDAVKDHIASEGLSGFMNNCGWVAIPGLLRELKKRGLQEDYVGLKALWERLNATYDSPLDDEKVYDFFENHFDAGSFKLTFE